MPSVIYYLSTAWPGVIDRPIPNCGPCAVSMALDYCVALTFLCHSLFSARDLMWGLGYCDGSVQPEPNQSICRHWSPSSVSDSVGGYSCRQGAWRLESMATDITRRWAVRRQAAHWSLSYRESMPSTTVPQNGVGIHRRSAGSQPHFRLNCSLLLPLFFDTARLGCSGRSWGFWINPCYIAWRFKWTIYMPGTNPIDIPETTVMVALEES